MPPSDPLQQFADAGNAIFPAAGSVITTLQPRNEKELADILRRATREGAPVTISGALTGLTGSGVPLESGYRIDMSGLTSLEDRPGFRRVAPFLLLSETDPLRGIVAPGISLRALNEVLHEIGLWFPPHPGETRALIGGNVATNASGPRTFAFGSTRSYVNSLRVVLMDGDILNLKRGDNRASGKTFALHTEGGRELFGEIPGYTLPKVKNAAGLFAAPDMDLIDLFIGSEGILGAFSEIGLRFLPRREIQAEIFFLPDAGAALDFVDELRTYKADAPRYAMDPQSSGIGILSLEFFDENSLKLVGKAGYSIPHGVHAAVEVEWFVGDESTREIVSAAAGKFGFVGTLGGIEAPGFRHAVPRKVADRIRKNSMPKFGTDFAVPVESFREMFRFYERMETEFSRHATDSESIHTAKWGHIGDCHLHCNLLPVNEEEMEKAKGIYLRLVHEAIRLGGTISAEHGVGKKMLADEQGVLHPYVSYLLGEEGLREIARVKKIFDPRMLLNRGNMVPNS